MGRGGVNILIVEDDTLVSSLLQGVLEGTNVEFLLANSIAQADGFIANSVVDVIILDRILPDGDGVTLLKKLKLSPVMKKIPVLILSGKTEVLDQVAGLDLGADDYMCKPFSVDELKARVYTLIRRAQKFV